MCTNGMQNVHKRKAECAQTEGRMCTNGKAECAQPEMRCGLPKIYRGLPKMQSVKSDTDADRSAQPLFILVCDRCGSEQSLDQQRIPALAQSCFFIWYLPLSLSTPCSCCVVFFYGTCKHSNGTMQTQQRYNAKTATVQCKKQQRYNAKHCNGISYMLL
jgi:hypothetical protein